MPRATIITVRVSGALSESVAANVGKDDPDALRKRVAC